MEFRYLTGEMLAEGRALYQAGIAAVGVGVAYLGLKYLSNRTRRISESIINGNNGALEGRAALMALIEATARQDTLENIRRMEEEDRIAEEDADSGRRFSREE